MAITGLGLGVGMPLINLAVQNSFHQRELGAATASTQLFRSIGSTVGVALMGGVLNNLMSQKLSNISSEPFIKMAQATGNGDKFSNLDVNSIQGILNPAAQQVITGSFQKLPSAARDAALSAFQHLVLTLQTALSSSITRVFVLSAGLMAIAFLVSFFIKEIPLKHHVGDENATPSPSA